jgi:hypothetical protein
MSLDALESAILIQLRDSIKWDSSLATDGSTGTLTPIDPDQVFDASRYQRRDRELAFRDTINAAAVVEVSLEVADVWNTQALRPRMQGAQRTALPYVPSDGPSFAGKSIKSSVFHVGNSSIPFDAVRADADLYGRDLLIYEALARACAATFAAPPITVLDATGSIIPNTIPWSKAYGTNTQADISTALPLNRELFRNPDQYLAERDNQLAGYAARLIQVLKNPFEYANRLYVRISGNDDREIEVYSLVRNNFTPGGPGGSGYVPGDEVFYVNAFYRALVNTTNLPTVATDWLPIDSTSIRTWIAEPALSNRNRIVYNTSTKLLQWSRETTGEIHVPQLYAMSIPGIVPGQTIDTLAQVPDKKDAQFWRTKAGKVVFNGQSQSEVAVIENTASFAVSHSLIQLGGASLTVPGIASFDFGGTISPDTYRVAVLVKPHSLIEIAGAQNAQGVGGTLGGATIASAGTQLTWQVGLPPGIWTMSFDYTNLTGTSNGFSIKADYGGVEVLKDTVPLYFNDSNGQALVNGQLVTSPALNVIATGSILPVNLKWTSGNGQLHVRTIRFQGEDITTGRYKMSGTLAGEVSNLDVVAQNCIDDVATFDFYTGITAAARFDLFFEADGLLPVRFLQAHLQRVSTNVPTPASTGFEGWKQEMLERAYRSVDKSYRLSLLAAGTNVPEFRSTGSTWDSLATEKWMAFTEIYEPRLRQIDTVPEIVEQRQYSVTSGTVTYDGQQYLTGKSFVGNQTSSYSGGSLKQVGAFTKSRAGHIGRPALIPSGLAYSTSGTVSASAGVFESIPTIAALQPWMVEAGLYVAQPEFWSADFNGSIL